MAMAMAHGLGQAGEVKRGPVWAGVPSIAAPTVGSPSAPGLSACRLLYLYELYSAPAGRV